MYDISFSTRFNFTFLFLCTFRLFISQSMEKKMILNIFPFHQNVNMQNNIWCLPCSQYIQCANVWTTKILRKKNWINNCYCAWAMTLSIENSKTRDEIKNIPFDLFLWTFAASFKMNFLFVFFFFRFVL